MSKISELVRGQGESLQSMVKEASEIRVSVFEKLQGHGVDMEKVASLIPEEKLLSADDVSFLANVFEKVANHIENMESQINELSFANSELHAKIDNTSPAELNKQAEFSESGAALIQTGLPPEVVQSIPEAWQEKFAQAMSTPESLGSASQEEARFTDPLTEFILS